MFLPPRQLFRDDIGSPRQSNPRLLTAREGISQLNAVEAVLRVEFDGGRSDLRDTVAALLEDGFERRAVLEFAGVGHELAVQLTLHALQDFDGEAPLRVG